jgi:hypothetical protein
MMVGAGPGQTVAINFYEVDCDLKAFRLLAISEGMSQPEVMANLRYLTSAWKPIAAQLPADLKARSVCMDLSIPAAPAQ